MFTGAPIFSVAKVGAPEHISVPTGNALHCDDVVVASEKIET